MSNITLPSEAADYRIMAVALRRLAVLSDESLEVRARADVLADRIDSTGAPDPVVIFPTGFDSHLDDDEARSQLHTLVVYDEHPAILGDHKAAHLTLNPTTALELLGELGLIFANIPGYEALAEALDDTLAERADQ